jgi:hypothetical protein
MLEYRCAVGEAGLADRSTNPIASQTGRQREAFIL